MAPTDKHHPSPVTIARLEPADLGGAQALVAESGWNQIADDWRFFVEQGLAFKVSSPQGAVIATAATLPYRPGFGWISMVLVTQAHRRGGIATALLQHCIASLRRDGLVPVLDATPAGREVYRLLGFRDGWPITRWRRQGRGEHAAVQETHPAIRIRAITEADWPAIDAMDAAAFGAKRSGLLRSLAARSNDFCCLAQQDGQVAGFLLGRDGRVATQIGPIVARNEEVAELLLRHALTRIEGPVLIDVLDRHMRFAPLLTASGFAVERGYTRMTLDTQDSFGDAALTFAIAGPELG